MATWPVVLREPIPSGLVRLRPLNRGDERAWHRLRSSNYHWLRPWEATTPGNTKRPVDFRAFITLLDKQGKSGSQLPWAVEYNGELAGQITVAAISYGALYSATIGYWVSQALAGRGITPTAVALATDYCFWALGLHRMEINICTNNGPSLRVVEKLGFRDEGLRVKYLHINGQWEDHRAFAILSEDVPGGLLTRWRNIQADQVQNDDS